MQIDAKMVSDQPDNERKESELLMERTQVETGTEGTVHGSDIVEQQALCGCHSTTAKRTNQKLSRVESQRKPISLGVL